jgi:hypothetical protein
VHHAFDEPNLPWVHRHMLLLLLLLLLLLSTAAVGRNSSPAAGAPVATLVGRFKRERQRH